MSDKTKTIVIIESHQRTIIRRSRRLFSDDVITLPLEHPLQAKGEAPHSFLKTATLKHTTGGIFLKPLWKFCVLCVSVVNRSPKSIHHRDTENTEDARRKIN